MLLERDPWVLGRWHADLAACTSRAVIAAVPKARAVIDVGASSGAFSYGMTTVYASRSINHRHNRIGHTSA